MHIIRRFSKNPLIQTPDIKVIQMYLIKDTKMVRNSVYQIKYQREKLSAEGTDLWGEAATLRSLANSAKLLENNPTLLQLRILQAIGESTGNTILLNTSNDGIGRVAK